MDVVVVVAPIQANTSAKPITRELFNEQAAKMKGAAVRRQREAEDRKRALQGALAASSSRSNAGSSCSAGSSRSSSRGEQQRRREE